MDKEAGEGAAQPSCPGTTVMYHKKQKEEEKEKDKEEGK